MAATIDAIDGFALTRSGLQGLANAPSLKSLVGLLAFFLASSMQHDCHVHLASLPKYSLPSHPFFAALVCPHYTAECLIYLSLAVIAAPAGRPVNPTVLSGLLFVAVMLAVSARANRQWYRARFGDAAVAKKWNMMPRVF